MGWYKEVWPFNVTNDHKFVSQSNWECLQALSDIALQRIMDHDGKIDLLVTHFPLSTSEAKLLSQKVKRVLIGHWHEPVDAEWFGMRIINTGSNYHQPIYKVLEI
jgi:predicted phosphodiesterase